MHHLNIIPFNVLLLGGQWGASKRPGLEKLSNVVVFLFKKATFTVFHSWARLHCLATTRPFVRDPDMQKKENLLSSALKHVHIVAELSRVPSSGYLISFLLKFFWKFFLCLMCALFANSAIYRLCKKYNFSVNPCKSCKLWNKHMFDYLCVRAVWCLRF